MVRIASLAALCGALIAYSSCAFFGADPFPDTLEYLSARKKLSSLYADAGLSDPVYFGNVRILRSAAGYERVFLHVSAYEGQRLFVFDAEDLEPLAVSAESNLSSFLAASPNGNFVCGGVEFEPETLSVISNALSTSGYGSETRSVVDGTDLYVFYPLNPGFMLLEFDTAYMVANNFGPGYSADSSESILSAHLDAAGAVRLLFAGNWGTATLLSFESLAVMEAAFSSSSATSDPLSAYASSVRSIPLDDRSGWLTDDGAVALSYDDGARLSRYPYGVSAAADEQVLDRSGGDRRWDFSADGKKRVLYDEDAGFLYLMRTWWK